MKKFIILAMSMFLAFSIIVPSSVLPTSAAVSTSNQALIDQKADAIVKTAISLIGQATYQRYVYKPTYPYQFGCSGFIYFVFLQNGINLATRDTQLQAQLGDYVPKDQLKKGDLVFFSNSSSAGKAVLVGIYNGNYQVILAAGSSLGVINAFMLTSFYQTYYVTARRIV